MSTMQRWRYLSLALFFLAFFLVPVADLFRYDLYQHHFILLGKPLSLGLDSAKNARAAPTAEPALMVAFIDSNLSGQWDVSEKRLVETELAIADDSGKTYQVKTDALGEFEKPPGLRTPVASLVLLTDADARHILLYLLLPFVVLGITLALIAWRWGRLYCGWLCPHYSVVEIINGLMRRASGKPNIWMKKPLPNQQSDGRSIQPNAWYWAPAILAILSFSLLWAVGILSYVLPPKELYYNLYHFSLDRWQLLATLVITLIFFLDFTFARHLFCRYGCSVGILQSLFWMNNRRALVVGFDRSRVNECIDCDASCEIACPMMLPPRGIKRKKFSCTQCMLCIEACERVQVPRQQVTLLRMMDQGCALNESGHDFGKRTEVAKECFDPKK